MNSLKWLSLFVVSNALTACSSMRVSFEQDQPVGRASEAQQLRASSHPAKIKLPHWMRAGNWHHQTFVGKPATRYHGQQVQGREALQAHAERSMSVMRQELRLESHAIGLLKFSWLATSTLANADVSQRDTEDAKLRILLRFEGDRGRFSAKNRMLSELALTLTGEELPYATLMYVWCRTRPIGEIITNPRTDRIRKIVIESGEHKLGQWLDYERDIRADFRAAFGEEPGALTGIALMTDTDNTQSNAVAWYGPISFKSAER